MSTKIARQIDKARRFYDYLVEVLPEITPAQIESLTTIQWQAITDAKNQVHTGRVEQIPSHGTRRLVANCAAMRSDTSEPFHGLSA